MANKHISVCNHQKRNSFFISKEDIDSECNIFFQIVPHFLYSIFSFLKIFFGFRFPDLKKKEFSFLKMLVLKSWLFSLHFSIEIVQRNVYNFYYFGIYY